MKTKEELNALREELETMNGKLAALSDDELKEVVGGIDWLREESGRTAAWYGLDNREDIFDSGSEFHVRWIDRDENDDFRPEPFLPED